MLLASLTVLSPILLSEAAALDPSAERGEAIFREKCASCHTIGDGDLVGPDLEGITEQRDPQWLARFIQEPDQVIAEGDPLALRLLEEYSNIPMPNQGLSQQDTDDIIAYIVAQSGGAPEEPPEEPAELVGDPLIGQSLFVGSTDFQNGGPPCQACHHVEGASRFGGGLLGPDLTSMYSRFGDAGISSVLTSLPFPTMKPIYDDRPLTPQEQADLKAFFEAAANREIRVDALEIGYLALIGFAAAILLIHLLWRKRLVSVRRPMVQGVTKEKVK